MPAPNIQKLTERMLRDLHARESMRLGWYRQNSTTGDMMQQLRERKSQHTAFLMDLLRKRGLRPSWYSKFFYLAGHIFGWMTAPLPQRWVNWMERTMEFWILMRYERYLKRLQLHFNLRSMIEAVQLKKLSHDEPGPDVLQLLEAFLNEQRQLVSERLS